MRSYAIAEVFGTLQGEGAQAGTPSVFLRFAGCNLGYDICPWCDTDWVKAEYREDLKGTLDLVEKAAVEAFGTERDGLLLVATGGEPSLQMDRSLSTALRERGYRIAMESNGSRPVDRSLVDWLTISPKEPEFVQKEGDEIKILFTGGQAPGPGRDVAAVRRLAEGTRFDYHFLQPIDLPDSGGPNFAETVRATMELGPPWRLSIQTHKLLNIP